MSIFIEPLQPWVRGFYVKGICRTLAICCAVTSSAQAGPQGVDSASFRVLVLDALSGKPQADADVPYLCNENPHSLGMKSTTDLSGFAVVPYTCTPGIKIEVDAVPRHGKAGCGSGAEATLETIMSQGVVAQPDAAGGIWCPTKISRKLTPVPGQVILFVKKPTWWQSHVAG